MAELALGLTKTAVEETVSRVKSAIDEEEKLKDQVQNDLVFITDEFEMMQSFLNVANKERTKNEVVRTWVRQIRDLAFDVEDCIELVVSLDIRSGWSWLWHMLPSCMQQQRPLNQAFAEIQRLKARVEDVSHRNTRYSLIVNSGTDSKSAALVNTVSKTPAAPESMHSANPSSASFHILRGVWEAAGKMRHDMGDLRKLINRQEKVLEVISIWGGPGSAADLGATHVIQEAYSHPKICEEFKSRAWVKMTHPFNGNDFLSDLLTQFYASSHRAKVLSAEFQRKMRAVLGTKDDLRKAQLMKQVIDEQRYLVIVEQLSTVGEWDTIRMYLPDSENGSRIVVTTHQLGLALSCMGNPYQVSELRQLCYGQSLCAVFSKLQVCGRLGELIWQLKCGGVISVWGCMRDETTLVYKVYTAIMHKSKEFEGVEFKRHIWVDVPNPFDWGIFSLRLFFNFHSDDLRAKEIKAASRAGGTALIEMCRKFLCKDNCLVVINGLNSTDDWGDIKAAFFPEPCRGCFIVITEKESVATHCAFMADRVLNIKDLDDDVLLRQSVKGCEYHGIGDKEASRRGHFFSNRREEARDWMDKFGSVVDRTGFYSAEHRFNVSSLRWIDGAEKLAVAKKLYYDQMPDVGEGDVRPRRTRFPFTEFSWVDVPDPFDLTDFCWRLLLDFHSDDLEAKQTVAVELMEGLKDPIQGCFELLRDHECFIVIDGLRSGDDWNNIKSALFSRRRQGPIKPIVQRRILVITKDKSVDLGDGLYCIGRPNYDLPADPPLIKKPGYSDQDISRAFSSTRMIEACDWIKKFRLIGHHQNIEWNKLLDKRQGVISVWGVAGIGKSDLIRRFYYTSMTGSYRGLIRAERSDFLRLDCHVTKYAWVDVPYPFDLTDLSSRLILDFHSDDLEAKEAAAVGMMQGLSRAEVCQEFLHQHKCLIIIDGLRSKDDWDLIKDAFLSEQLKGHILVVTNEESIARHCVVDTEKDVVNVKGLNADRALDVFSKAMCYPVSGKEIADWKESNSMQQLSKLIMKCGGLPQVLTAIGEYCREYQHIRRCGLETVNAADFMGMLETDPKFHSLRSLFDWMQSYFVACPDSLKPCIFYLSVFSLGHDIRKRRLLRRWIAEGYSRDTLGSTVEENGEKFISELVKLSIIQQRQSPSKEDLCQVNGFFREYIFSRPMQDNLVFALEGHCIPNTQRAGQHLTISRCWDRDKILFESMELSRLRSLTVFGDWRSFFISKKVKMKYLRVLDLEDTSGVTNGNIEKIGNLLPHLKFLSLRGCENITRLPASLGGLRQLQTLDIKGTRIVTLSPTIIKLKKLQYVRAGPQHDGDVASTSQGPAAAAATPPPVHGDGDGAGVSTSQPPPTAAADVDEARTSAARRSRPRGGFVFSSAHDGVQFPIAAAWGLGKLTALHTLGVVNVSSVGGKAVLRELKKITQLRKLKLSGINRKNWQDFCYTISGHGYLESLSVRLDDDEQQDHLCNLGDISKPPKTLKSLKLYKGNVHVSPVWMKQLDGLKKVDVEDLELTISEQVDIDSLKDLRCKDKYRHLRLKPIEDVKLHYDWREEDWISGGFGDATVLKINCGSYRSEIAFGLWITRTILSLVVHCSTSESSLELSGLENLSRLEEVWLTGSYNEAVKQHLQQQLADHANEPVLHFEDQSEYMCIPSIYFCS